MRSRQWAVALVCALLGLAAVAVVKGQGEDEFLGAAREPDLVRLLDDLQARQARLDAEILTLQASRERLLNGTSAEALAQTQQRADDLRVLAGTTPVRGPGIRAVVTGDQSFFAEDLLNTVQELRDAGAESIEVNDQRIVVNSWFSDDGDGISISGTKVGAPYEILAIGDPSTMATAMRIPGGVVDTVRSQDGAVVVTELDKIVIDSTVDLSQPDPNVKVTD